MKNKNLNLSIVNMVEEELLSINKVKDASTSIRKFNKLKYLQPKRYTAKDIRRIRKRLRISQAILAYLINTKISTVQKWESGINKPNGPASRLLQLLERNGLEVIQIS